MWAEAVTTATHKVITAAEAGDLLEDNGSMLEEEPSIASIDAILSGCTACAAIGDACDDCLQADIDTLELEDLESFEDLDACDDD
jgi:hypothetical protein